MSEKINNINIITLDDVDEKTINVVRKTVSKLNTKKFIAKVKKMKSLDLCDNEFMNLLEQFEKEFIGNLYLNGVYEFGEFELKRSYLLDDDDLVISSVIVNNKYNVMLALRLWNYKCGTKVQDIIKEHGIVINAYIEPYK